MRGVPTKLIRRIAVGALILAVAAVAYVVFRSSSNSHDVYVTVPNATGVVNGQFVKSAGTNVGKVAKITPVEHGRAARLKLSLQDTAWPLYKGSTFTLRWAGTINSYNRYIALVRGRAGGPVMVHDGGNLPASALHVPVEFGDVLGIFTPKVRGNLKALIDQGGPTISEASPDLQGALRPAPPALDQADHVLRDLNANEDELHTLVRSTGRVVDAVDRSDPNVGRLVAGAGTTFDAIAKRAQGTEATLAQAPATFRHARTTLARANPTLVAARDLTRRLAPGVVQLREIAQPLDHLLVTLNQVGPDARTTLATAGRSAPDITRLVTKANRLSPELSSILSQSDKALNCIRPYTPELATFGALWSSHQSTVQGQDKVVRANIESFIPAPTNITPYNAGEAAKLNPGLRYAFPFPPGYWAGQPWFIPKCHITKAALDPSKDPEGRPGVVDPGTSSP